jgi:hypothetical protein
LITKRCPSCKQSKSLNDFPRNRTTRDGRATYCKPCHNRIMSENKQRLYGGQDSYLLKLRYGASSAQLEWLKLQQGGLCAICREAPAVHVDHDHRTKQVRGVLCFNCNRGLGYLDDDIVTLYRAADYLESHGRTT